MGEQQQQHSSRQMDADADVHIRGSEMEAEDEEASDSLGLYGCVWDETGAGNEDRMELNCDRLSEDECIATDNGNKDGRCVWKAKNHQKGAHKDTITNAGKEQNMKVSTMDILLGAAFIVTAAFALQRLYRWWADRGYIKLAEQPQDVEPLLMTQV